MFVTADKNIHYQQRLSDRSFAIVEVFTNRLPKLREWSEAILHSIRSITGNEYLRVGPEYDSGGND